MAKSSYWYQLNSMNNDKYEALRLQIKYIFNDVKGRYGYRRIHSVIKASSFKVSEKILLKIMKEEHLVVTNSKNKKNNSYKGEISYEIANVIDLNFHADKPNTKWLTI